MKPILFNSEMVRAVLDGRKTQTRRVIRLNKFLKLLKRPLERNDFHAGPKCPYGKVGDKLWVRETWRIGAWNENAEFAIDYKADNYARREWLRLFPDAIDECEKNEKMWIQCSDDCEKAGLMTNDEGNYKFPVGESPCRWRPNIFMPKTVTRIFLEITDIKIERVQGIGYLDILAEGITEEQIEAYRPVDEAGIPFGCGLVDLAKYPWIKLWDSINKKRGYGWDVNPWVWVVKFKKVEG